MMWISLKKQWQCGKSFSWIGVFGLLLLIGSLACTLSSEAPTPLPTLISPAAITPLAEATVAPDNPFSVANLEPFTDAEMGLTFNYPAGWQTMSFPTFVAVASNATLLAEDAPYIEDGALVLVAGGTDQANTGVPLVTALEAAIADLDVAASAQITEGPTETTINDQEAVVAILSAVDENSGENIFFHVTYLRNGGYGAVVAGTTLQADAEQFRPVFETIAGSVRLSPPQQTQADLPVPEPAGAITLNETVTGEIPQEGAVAWTFDGTAGTAVNIIAEPTTGSLDLIVDVVDASGRSILPGGAIDESAAVETVTNLTLPTDGAYQIILSGFLGFGGEYNLTLNTDSSGLEALQPGTIITGSLSAGTPDLYGLQGTAGVSITLLVAPSPEMDVVLQLFDLNDNTLLLSQDEGFTGEGELAIFTPERTGEYLVQVSEFTGSGSGNYTMNVATESSALLAESGQLAAGEAVNFTLPFPAGETIVVAAVPGEGFDLVVSLLDAAGELLSSTDLGFENAPELFAYSIPADGDYTIRINGFEESAGTYRLIVASESTAPIDEPVEANVSQTLTPGRTLADALPAAGEKVYRFTGRAGQTATFFIYPEDELDVVAEVNAPDGAPLLRVDEGFTGEGEVVRFSPPSTGEYQLTIRSFVAIGGNYVLGMLDESTALLNDSGMVANNASVGYEVTIPAGATRVILLFPEDAFDALVEILDSDQQVIAESDIGIAGEPEILRFTAPSGGEYTIRISGFVNIGGSFTIVMIDQEVSP